jgi:tartronate-semialdehyde synthase
MGCRAIRVFDPEKIAEAIAWAKTESVKHGVPCIVEVITERITNIAMGAEINAIKEYEEIVDLAPAAREPQLV